MMRTVMYKMSVSMDGFTAGPDGDISWTAPDPELMAFHIAQTRELTTQFMGRRLYQAMLPWEDDPALTTDPLGHEFARIWTAIPKVVFSSTLTSVAGNARLAAADAADELARVPSGVVGVGGPGLAASLVARDLVDEYRIFVVPVLLGGGTPLFPPLDRPLDFALAEQRTFGSRVVYLRYVRER